ncbi:MAG: hypothetical protein JJU27_14190 [Gammaproteobacteria bacterium]|nr:hypothetical protein [Gammaproteobacteria bacterium]
MLRLGKSESYIHNSGIGIPKSLSDRLQLASVVFESKGREEGTSHLECWVSQPQCLGRPQRSIRLAAAQKTQREAFAGACFGDIPYKVGAAHTFRHGGAHQAACQHQWHAICHAKISFMHEFGNGWVSGRLSYDIGIRGNYPSATVSGGGFHLHIYALAARNSVQRDGADPDCLFVCHVMHGVRR